MKLPLLISNPHAGLVVPPEVKGYCVLTDGDVAADGDEGAAEIFDLRPAVAAYRTTDIARAIVDLNRTEDDRSPDGVVKTHTCWNVPVYRDFPPEGVVEMLLERYYRPYHASLARSARFHVRLGVDCHTMAAVGPPIGPSAGQARPLLCLSNADETCPQSRIQSLAGCFEEAFGAEVSINAPFKGGFIIRRHCGTLPWVQLELSRAPFATNDEKRRRVLAALTAWCQRHLPDGDA